MSLSAEANKLLSGSSTWGKVSAHPDKAFLTLKNLLQYQAHQHKREKAQKIQNIIKSGCHVLKEKELSQSQCNKIQLLKELGKQQKKAIRAREKQITSELIRPVICTAEIKNAHSLRKLKTLAHQWEITAHAQQKCPHRLLSQKLDSSTLNSIEDCKWVSDEIRSFIPEHAGRTHDVMYAAYKTNNKVIGLMMTTSSEKTNSIDFIVSSPKSQNLLGIETRTVRGAATALIRHFAEKILERKDIVKKEISLFPLSPAIPVYQHLGFVRKGRHMVLTEDKMKELVESNTGTHVVQETEPDELKA